MSNEGTPDDSTLPSRRREPLGPVWIDWAAVAEAQGRRRAAGLDNRLDSLTPFVRYGDPPAEPGSK